MKLIDILQESLAEANMDNYELLARIKHELGTKLLGVGSSVRNLEKALDDNMPDWKETRVSKNYNVTMVDTVESIKKTLGEINEILLKYEDLANKQK
jgi:signal transduction histidine kinase